MLPTLPSISIVILSYNHWGLTHRCLFELTTKLPQVEIIVVDNNSSDKDVRQGMAWWKTTGLGKKLEFIMLSDNQGFGGGNNIGIAESMSDIVVVTQPDMITYRDWVTPMRQMLTEHPKSLVGGRLIDFDGGWNRTPDGGFVPYLEGFLIGAYKDIWEDLGMFDGRYFPCDMEDCDLSTTALSKGYQLLSLNGEDYKHLGGAVIGDMEGKRRAITEAHRQLWLQKWEGKFEKIERKG
jgi:GT2 family glycosyltransferase